MSSNMHLEPEERELVGELLARRGRCPSPEEVLASLSGVLPEETGSRIAKHLTSCPACRALSRDLADSELTGPTPEEAVRIRQRVLAAAAPARWFGLPRRWLLVPAFATLTLIVAGVLWFPRDQQPTPPATATQPPAPALLPLEKPVIRLPASAVLVWRGAAPSEGQKYVADLTAALAPFRRDDFADAARLFEALTLKYPKAAEAHFYLGASLLFLNRPADAAGALNRARPLAEGALAHDITWYLAVAYQRAGNTEQAAAELQKLCQEQSSLQEKACKARQEITGGR